MPAGRRAPRAPADPVMMTAPPDGAVPWRAGGRRGPGTGRGAEPRERLVKSRVITHHDDLSWQEPTERADPVILTEPAGAELWGGTAHAEAGRPEPAVPGRPDAGGDAEGGDD